AREADDVGLLRGEREEARAIAPDNDGRMRPLDRAGINGMPRDSIVLTDERDLRPAEQALDDRHRLGKPLEPDPSTLEGQPRLVVLGAHVPGAEPKLEPAVAQQIRRRSLTRHE